ncbi:hypothetical protein ABZX98_35025 [Streptomyces sp. NPDC002992]|uniref:hypothetical protein n=1 Tax=Streptomyces sp. NPDC002992 TaxID=3154273 RepID=UPI0033A06670
MVNAVLIGFAILSVPVFFFALMWMQGERDNLKKATELVDIGIEVQARLTYAEPIRDTGTLRVVYEFEGPNGEKGRHQTGVGVSSVHVVGNTYPLVHHPQRVNRVHLGTKRTVRKERKERAGYVKTAQAMALGSFVVFALAVGGFVLSP